MPLLSQMSGMVYYESIAFMDSSVASTVNDFFKEYRLRKYSKGQILIFNGDQSEFVFQLVSGRVKQYDVTYRGDEVILNVFQPPAFFPMSMAINQTPNPYTYEAETDIEIRQAPAEEVIQFLKQNPEVMFDLLGRVYRGVEGLLGRMVHLMASSARGRLVFELLVSCRRYGEQNANGSYALTMSESELGARSGLSRETVSREMRKLEKEGLLHIKSGTITIPSLESIEKKLSKVV